MKALRNIPISAFNYWKLILLHQLLFNLLLLPINTLAVPYSSLLSTLNIFERINRVSLSTVSNAQVTRVACLNTFSGAPPLRGDGGVLTISPMVNSLIVKTNLLKCIANSSYTQMFFKF